MDISRLKKNDLRVWLPLADGVEVLARYISQARFDAISRQAEETRFDPKSHQKTVERNEVKFRSLLAQEVVEDWRGLLDDGEPYPCTPEHIDYLVEEWTEFRLLVMDAPLSLEKMLAIEKESAGKNSVSTSAQLPIIPA
jgi:hypothetical protein